jgi:curved DNA-binding protein CbpA
MTMTAEAPDYYETLQINRNATALVITKVYRLLAALYHPDNKDTGDAETFRQLAEAHAVLADPVRRATYDRERFGAHGDSTSSCSSPADSRVTEVLYRDECELRQLVLLALYTTRRSRPNSPAVPLVVLLELFGCTVDEVQFTLWYLRGKKFIETQDDGVAITVNGVDHVEEIGADRDGLSPSAASHRRMLEAVQRVS